MSDVMFTTVSIHNPDVKRVIQIVGAYVIRLAAAEDLHNRVTTEVFFKGDEAALKFVTDLVNGIEALSPGFRGEVSSALLDAFIDDAKALAE